MCASYYDNMLFIGDNRDCMYWLDCSNGLFNVLEVGVRVLIFKYYLITLWVSSSDCKSCKAYK
jgi:hypothetical protein